jgi:hypothetical protein
MNTFETLAHNNDNAPFFGVALTDLTLEKMPAFVRALAEAVQVKTVNRLAASGYDKAALRGVLSDASDEAELLTQGVGRLIEEIACQLLGPQLDC